VPTSQWEQKLAPATRAAVQDPSVNYLFPLYDNEVSFVSPAVIEAGAQERVGVVSFNATPGIVEALADPNEPLAADVGSPPVWTGWAFADQAFRILAGGKPITDEKLPYRLFTKENSAEINFEEPEEKWYGAADFKGGYEELWGL
jgi:ribose transport system substrate-binding protein